MQQTGSCGRFGTAVGMTAERPVMDDDREGEVMVKKSWISILSRFACCGIFAVSSAAQGSDGQIFATSGLLLTDQLAEMSACGDAASCSAPSSVCDSDGNACGDLLGDGCGDACGEGLFGGSGSGIEIGGWVQGGYHNKNTPFSFTRNDNLSFNDRPDSFNMHQIWLYAEKAADGSNGMDWGFRADLMYGTDAAATQAFGNNPGTWDFDNGWDRGDGYGWAMPQLYAEVASGDWSIIGGHFYTLVGYEVVTAPDNFFYSHAWTMFNSEPFTHTGVLATYSAADDVTLYGGWTAGWDTGFDQLGGGSSFLGGASFQLSEDSTATYITTIGDFGWRGEGYSHSIVIDTDMGDGWNHVLQSDVVRADDYDTVGINNYLFYTVSDTVKAGTRMEWWKADGESFNAATFGVNVTPMDNLILRPEVRYNWDGDADITVFGIDAIVTF